MAEVNRAILEEQDAKRDEKERKFDEAQETLDLRYVLEDARGRRTVMRILFSLGHAPSGVTDVPYLGFGDGAVDPSETLCHAAVRQAGSMILAQMWELEPHATAELMQEWTRDTLTSAAETKKQEDR